MTEFCMNCGKVINTETDFLPVVKLRYKFHHNCEKHYMMILRRIGIILRSKESEE